MSEYNCKSPVLFLVFNRPDVTARVFEAIRAAKPPRLYVAADGPRLDRVGEKEKVDQVRLIATQVDWECEIQTLFRDQNLGCGKAVSQAITWFFENEEMGIIFEDDCLPDFSFFRFCDELLIKYKDDEHVHHIGGTNPLSNIETCNKYYFSRYNRIWGWASWSSSWSNFDLEMKRWPSLKNDKFLNGIFNPGVAEHFSILFEKTYNGGIDTWDYQWLLSRLQLGGAIVPSVNLVANIGFGADSTHTSNLNSPLANMKTGEVLFPLSDPSSNFPDWEHDEIWAKFLIKKVSVITRFINKVKELLSTKH
jgi:hypothetical protein